MNQLEQRLTVSSLRVLSGGYTVVYGTLQVVRKIAECVFGICQQTTPECYWKVHLKYIPSVHGKVCR